MSDWLQNIYLRSWVEEDPERDHSAGLMVSGILTILLGLLAFVSALMLSSLLRTLDAGVIKHSHTWIVTGLLLALSVWLILLGLGSIRAARWARALALVGAWVTLFFGTLAMALFLYILPGICDVLSDAGILVPSDSMGPLYFFVLGLVLLQLVLPMGVIFYYRREGVRATCERRNPTPCWTDRCPLPLLAMGFISVLGCLAVVLGASVNYVVFLFGRVLTGWQGFPVVLLISAVCGYVGWGAFTRRMHAWWLAYALIVVSSASMMLTFAELDLVSLYGAMGYSTSQILASGRFDLLSPAVLTFITCVWGIMACIYLVWVRDCFQPETATEEIKSYRQRKAEEKAARAPEPVLQRMRLEE